MRKIKVGNTYNRWTVIGRAEGAYKWECRCSCGTIKNIFGAHLLSGRSSSCGCKMREEASEKSRRVQRELGIRTQYKDNGTGYRGVVDVGASYKARLSVSGFKTPAAAHECYVFLKKMAREYMDKNHPSIINGNDIESEESFEGYE